MTRLRLYLTADSRNKPGFQLPWNYHLSIQSAIYDALNEYAPEIATELHQLSHDPPFSFSEFLSTAPYNVGDDGITFNRGFLSVTSPRAEILEAVASWAAEENLTLGHTTLPVIGSDLEPVHGVIEAEYRSVSPVCVSQYRDDRREYLQPDDGMWYARLRDSTRDRLEGERGELPADFEFAVDSIERTKSKRLRVSGGGWATCSLLTATIRADPVTSAFIQNYGLGERTGLGFGCVVPADHLPEAVS